MSIFVNFGLIESMTGILSETSIVSSSVALKHISKP